MDEATHAKYQAYRQSVIALRVRARKFVQLDLSPPRLSPEVEDVTGALARWDAKFDAATKEVGALIAASKRLRKALAKALGV